MSKWIEKLNEQNEKKIRERILKLKNEFNEFRLNYNDYPYERYQKAMNKRAEEIEELELLLNKEDTKQIIDDWREECERLKMLLGKVNILAVNIEPCDEKSDSNLRRLMAITSNYECHDIEFNEHAKKGIW